MAACRHQPQFQLQPQTPSAHPRPHSSGPMAPAPVTPPQMSLCQPRWQSTGSLPPSPVSTAGTPHHNRARPSSQTPHSPLQHHLPTEQAGHLSCGLTTQGHHCWPPSTAHPPRALPPTNGLHPPPTTPGPEWGHHESTFPCQSVPHCLASLLALAPALLRERPLIFLVPYGQRWSFPGATADGHCAR